MDSPVDAWQDHQTTAGVEPDTDGDRSMERLTSLVPYEKRPEHGGDAAAWAKAKAMGEEALRAGRVAAFTVAGGQGTRLGYDGPKGTFAVTPTISNQIGWLLESVLPKVIRFPTGSSFEKSR